jgi:transposase
LVVTSDINALPNDIETLKRLVIEAQADAALAKAELSGARALAEYLKLEIAKLRRAQYGQRSERGARLIDQLELELENAAATASEDEIAAAAAAARAARDTSLVAGHVRQKPVRRPLPAHLPRRRVVIPGPTACACCGGTRLSKIGEDITETMDVVPRQWFVTQHVREKLSCRDCEKISQPPAPFHVIARGLAGPSLLAMILFEKYGQHQPLNRQSERYAREGVPLDVSTMADHVGACTAVLAPLNELIRAHVVAAERLHGDDTTVPVLAKGKTRTGRLWTYVRDDRSFGGHDPPAAVYFYSPDRRGEHPKRHLAGFTKILQADAYSGFNELYDGQRKLGPITAAACWSHGRRHFYELADLALKKKRPPSPIAIAAVQKIDVIFAKEREINGRPTAERVAFRAAYIAPLLADLETWMRAERARLSRHADVAKAMDYMLKRWQTFSRFLTDGRIDLTNNAAERALRGIALGRKSWLFAGSDRGGERAAAMFTVIQTCKLNDVDPQAWLADVLARIADHPMRRLTELLPWNWQPKITAAAAKPPPDHTTAAA